MILMLPRLTLLMTLFFIKPRVVLSLQPTSRLQGGTRQPFCGGGNPPSFLAIGITPHQLTRIEIVEQRGARKNKTRLSAGFVFQVT